MNFVETKLYFTVPPMSIRYFNRIKSLENDVKTKLDTATLYIICRREVPTIRCLEHSIIEDDLTEETKSLDRFVSLSIEMKRTGFKTEAVYFLPKFVNKKEFTSSIATTSVEEMVFYGSRNIGGFRCKDDISPLITYEVLYVGQCTDELLTRRFRAHHALQKMLIEEDVISRKNDKSDELLIIPMRIESNTISVLTPGIKEQDWEKAILNSFNFTNKHVTLDAEKALVHNLNPKYNTIQFKNYPLSKDGLSNTDANAFFYSLAEIALLKYENGVIVGCPDDMFSSKIVGDDEGFTTIYNPGEDATTRYFEKIMAEMSSP